MTIINIAVGSVSFFLYCSVLFYPMNVSSVVSQCRCTFELFPIFGWNEYSCQPLFFCSYRFFFLKCRPRRENTQSIWKPTYVFKKIIMILWLSYCTLLPIIQNPGYSKFSLIFNIVRIFPFSHSNKNVVAAHCYLSLHFLSDSKAPRILCISCRILI